MIGHIEGTVALADEERVIISAGGVGYLIAITPETASLLKEGSHASLWTHLAVRENALDLYGFRSRDDLRLFELLVSVSGIGPKSALGILSLASAESLVSAIARGDASNLIKVSGIGKKTAEKLVLELHDKIGEISNASEVNQDDADTLEALTAMGYSVSEAREALKRIPPETVGSNDMLREALRQLSK